jgi:PAS domain S-box-containing protein
MNCRESRPIGTLPMLGMPAKKRPRKSVHADPESPPAVAAVLNRIVVWEWDADRDRILASPSLKVVYGISALGDVSHGIGLVHPDDRDEHQNRVLRSVERRRGYRSRFRIIRADDGRLVCIEERAEAIPTRVGAPLLIGFAVDVTGPMRPWLLESLDAAKEFCDYMLAGYARSLRIDLARTDAVTLGHWIGRATDALSEVKRPTTDRRRVPSLFLNAKLTLARNGR